MKRIKIDGVFYRVGESTIGVDDACELCHFDGADCPRVGDDKRTLFCVAIDNLPPKQTTYFIRDTKQGRAEWLARKLGN